MDDIIRQTVSSSSACMQQTNYYPKKLDRKEIANTLAKLEKTIGEPAGAHPIELMLMRHAYQANLLGNPANDHMLAAFLPTIKAAYEFTQAQNRTDPRGFHQSNYWRTKDASIVLGLSQKEMVRIIEEDKQEREWWFDQQWNLSCSGDPNFGLNFQTILHGAVRREPIAHRNIHFWMTGAMPESMVQSTIGKTFGELVSHDSLPRLFIDDALDSYIVADAFNDEDLSIDHKSFNLKLIQPGKHFEQETPHASRNA